MAARYHVDLTTTADKELAKIRRGQPKDADRLERAMIALGEDPHPAGCTPMKGLSGVWRIRMGDYRICYTIEHEVLTVLVLLGHTRDDVYPQLLRLLGR
ncbi:MAG: type II toxin-antitoxin system RelE family toxin [Pseudonocardiaceae bacterium]